MNCIQPVAVHLIGADRDDLTYLRDVEEGRVVAPKATILVLNEAHAYVETAGIRDDLKGYLFPGTSRGRRGNWLSEEPMTQTDAWRRLPRQRDFSHSYM
jgi:hypothetical protein